MIRGLNTYNFKLIFFSIIEKYSLSILQILGVILISYYFGFISLGIIGSFSLIVSVFSGISEFGGAFGVIRNENLSEKYISTAVFFSVIIGCLFYIFLYYLSPIYLHFIQDSEQFVHGLRLYGILIVLTPIQVISFTALIKLKKANKLTLINIISWILSILILLMIGNFYSFAPINVVFYFILLSFFRMTGAIYLLLKNNLLSSSIGFNSIDFFYHLSITGSNISNSITANIWTYAVSNLVSLEANSILSLFTKLRDISSGNLSHGIHRVIFGKLSGLKENNKKVLIKDTIIYFFIFNSIILFLIALLNDYILKIFSYDFVVEDYMLYVLFPLIIGLFYPFIDTLKAFLRHNKQTIAIAVEFITAIILIFVYFIINSITDLMLIFLLIVIVQSIIFNLSEKIFIK